MKILDQLFIEVIETLIKCEVEFLLIGGYAVNYYGYGRYTGDIDFWLRPTQRNKKKFLNAMTVLKRHADDIKEIEKFDFSKARVISIGEPPLRIDFLTSVNLVDFSQAWEKRTFLLIKEFRLPVVDTNL